MIDTTYPDFPADIEKIYTNVPQLQQLQEFNIVKFCNNFMKKISGLARGAIISKNFIE